jgi:hypothetical protein
MKPDPIPFHTMYMFPQNSDIIFSDQRTKTCYNFNTYEYPSRMILLVVTISDTLSGGRQKIISEALKTTD